MENITWILNEEIEVGEGSPGLDPTNERSTVCPFLGLRDDPATSYALPSAENHCHRTPSPWPVPYNYQGTICLAAKHSQCQFRTWDGRNRRWLSLLLKIFYGEASPALKWTAGLIWGTLFVIAAIFLADRLWDPFDLRDGLSAFLGIQTVIELPASAEPDLLSPGTSLNATSIPDASSSGPQIGTPFSVSIFEGGFVLHKVASGETLEDLAEKYNTSAGVLAAANQPVQVYRTAVAKLAAGNVRVEGGNLIPGTILVVLPGLNDPSGVPLFRVFYLMEDVQAAEFAAREGVPVADLTRFNGLGDEEWIAAGRWLILPVTEDGNR
jgi:hypothetical protein